MNRIMWRVSVSWLVVGCILGVLSGPVDAQSHCGGQDERACCLGERSAGACDSGLHEAAGCTGDCRCAHSIFSSSGTCRLDVRITPCGGNGQRACCLGERSGGACNGGLHEEGGCSGDCRCNHSAFSSSGTCRPDWKPTACGGAGQRACCIGERPQGACDANLYEHPGAPPGDNRCAGAIASSSGTCRPFTACGGEGQRACCLGERAGGACDADLYERPGAPSGDNTCRGAAASSSGTCVRFTHCGGENERACCVGERGASCDPGMTEEPGGVPANARCRNNLLSSSGHCRKLMPHFRELSAGACSYLRLREWSAEFIDGDMDRCFHTSADVAGHHLEHPARCRAGKFGFGLYGEFDVPDDHCVPSFGPATPVSCKDGKRTYHAYLLNTPERELGRAEVLCRGTTGIVNGLQAQPTRCFTDGTGWQGEFVRDDKACEGKGSSDDKSETCPVDVPSVAQVATQNQTRHELALWTQDLSTAQIPPKLIKHLAPDERYVLAGDKLPDSGHAFLLVLLDVTAVQAFNKALQDTHSTTPPYHVDEADAYGAIYVYNFYAMDPLPLIACKQSPLGYSQETGQYFALGAGRDVVPPPPTQSNGFSLLRPPSAKLPIENGCHGCNAGGGAGSLVVALAWLLGLRRRRRATRTASY